MGYIVSKEEQIEIMKECFRDAELVYGQMQANRDAAYNHSDRSAQTAQIASAFFGYRTAEEADRRRATLDAIVRLSTLEELRRIVLKGGERS